MAVLAQSYNQGVREVLTSLYAGRHEWKKRTKSSGTIWAWRPLVSIFAASTPEWITRNCDEADLTGGFLPRWLFIYQDAKDRNVTHLCYRVRKAG